MFLHNLVKFIMIIVILAADSYNANEDEFSTNDKLVLSPAELVDLVYEESRRGEESFEHDHVPKTVNLNDDDYISSKDSMKDEERLKTRKVWSRWSKWSKCSVTCGPGTFMRRRLCVAGRCAPGEREEQRRSCALAPCLLRAGVYADDLASSDD